MPVWKAMILGMVQGLTEFLPVSSSGHVLLFERLLNVDTGGSDMFLGIVLHTGTLFAVIAVYFKKLFALIKPPYSNLLKLIIATLPAALTGVFLGDIVNEIFFGGKYLWFAFAVTAVILALAEHKTKKAALFKPINCGRALFIGFSQAVAVIPGISRSGATLSAAAFCGADRGEAADFSFLMSVPIIAGALIIEIIKCVNGGVSIGKIGIIPLVLGAITAFAFGLLAIKVTVKAIKKGSYKFFCIYLIIISALLVVFRV